RPTAEPAAGTDVIAIREDRAGDLWVGTYSHGLLRFEPGTGRFEAAYRHHRDDPHSLSSDIVPRLLFDRAGTLWAATADGLNRFDAATGRFTVFKLDPQGRSQSYLDVVEDGEGTLWLGTDSSGLHRFDPATGRFTVYEHDANRPGTLSDNRVNSVHIDRAGRMWLGTQNGLDELDPKTGTFRSYHRREGPPRNTLGRLPPGEARGLLVRPNKRDARVRPQEQSVQDN